MLKYQVKIDRIFFVTKTTGKLLNLFVFYLLSMSKNLRNIFFIFLISGILRGQTIEEELNKIVDSYKLPFEYKWYNPQKKYLQISTKEEKIYFILGREIIANLPELRNKPHIHLHLVRRNREVPIWIKSDGESLSENDTLFFLGSFPRGDTTYLDPFNLEEIFYLFFDETYEGLRYELLPLQKTTEIGVSDVDFSYHFEEHHQYSIGVPEFSSQTVNGEGWVWALMSPKDDWIPNNFATFSQKLFPSDKSDSVSFRFFAFSAKYDSIKTKHFVQILINNDTAYKNVFPPGKNLIMEFKYPTEKLKFGKNDFKVINRGLIPKDTNALPPDVIGFQYFVYKSKEIPFARSSQFKFQVSSKSNISLYNFRHRRGLVLDTTDKKIVEIYGTPTISFFGSVETNGTLEVNFNDSVFEANQKGFYLFAIDSISNTFVSKFYPTSENSIIRDIQRLSINSVFLVISNLISITPEIANFFSNEGAKNASFVNNRSVWMFAKKLGGNNFFEKFGTGKLVKLWGVFPASYSKYFSYGYSNNFATAPKFLFVNDFASLEQAKIDRVNESYLFTDNNQADVIVIAPKIFSSVAEAYVDYRKSTNPDKNFLIVYTEDIYKEFNFGKKSPDAIKRFLVWAYYKYLKPKFSFLVIIGDANFDVRNVLKSSTYQDFVPAFGWPPTDYWYCLLEGRDISPEVNLGRIPIKSLAEGFQYLEKIKEYDNARDNPWMKNILFLSGGINQIEREYFYDVLGGTFAGYVLKNTPICVRTQVIRKSDEIVGSETDASFVRSAINSGLTLMIFAGHGSARVFDIDGWKVQTLNNKGRYGFFASFSCNTATFAEPDLISRNEEYALFPEKGFVGTLGSGGVSIRSSSLNLCYNMLTAISDPKIKTDYFIDFVNIAKARHPTNRDYFDLLTVYHYNYIGDPLLRMRLRRLPDLYFIDNVSIANEKGTNNFTEFDSLFVITGHIGNAGFSKFEQVSYNLKLIHTYENHSDTLTLAFTDICNNQSFKFLVPIRKRLGLHKFKLLINPENSIEEFTYSNNLFEREIEVFANSLFSIDPLQFWNVNRKNPVFRFIDPLLSESSQNYRFKIYDRPDTLSNLIVSSKPEELDVSSLRIDWRPRTSLPKSHFWLYALKESKDNRIQNQPVWLPFFASDESLMNKVHISIETANEMNLFSLKNFRADLELNELVLEPIRIPYKILSSAGNSRSHKGREITVNEKVYEEMQPDRDLVGFYVVVISHKDFSLVQHKLFETWGADPPLNDSTSIKLVDFLRDSVPSGDYLFLVAHDAALRLPIFHKFFNPESRGSLDTLKHVLKEWGSKFADSLWGDLYNYKNSYFLVARNFFGRKITLDEGWNLDGDTVKSVAEIVQYPKFASIQTTLFGPAKSWDSLSISLNLPNDTVSYQIKVFGSSSALVKPGKLLATNENKPYLSLSNLDAWKYPFLIFQIDFQNPYENSDLKFRRLNLTFQPSPEIALTKESPKVSRIDTLRGEYINFKLLIDNLSLRTDIEVSSLSITLKTRSAIDTLENQKIYSISTNSRKIFEGILLTDNFSDENEVRFTATQKFLDLFNFNNTQNLQINLYEDTIKPNIKLYLDGEETQGGEYVSRKPRVLIEIYDNSKLPFDTFSTTLLINTKLFDLAKNGNFISYGKFIPLKCSYSFESEELEYGLNHFTIYTSDFTGNKDTLDIPVYVSRKAKIVEHLPYPNPMSNNLSFKVRYISPISKAVAIVDIFDISGKKIRTITRDIKLNKDEIFWDGFDDFGNSISRGIYFYRISIVSEIYVDPVFGKILKLD
ncbi:MAG: C25 family cysteine peptidase [Ignavibacteria bacterium]|nr:C25 family cysteine peptidase [Ignavibacteria bacterium]